ncbi:hypothetical protein KDH_22430 [Dictyobacter sp. S3.2.2.5]|uniref:Uncharacterized protein n=1 Tax=Dictyobacter halimunensis TaxID=3026934 RepID=A0ABQ6FMD7_9CHLR|nr:hypothetical protein KDH_22430 [Dictyobacter sp. S3.2.2.5]
MRRQPGAPRSLVSWENWQWEIVRGMQQIASLLDRPGENMSRWFWHRPFLVHNRFSPQLPNMDEYSRNKAGKQT